MAFSLNVVSEDYVVEADYCGIVSGVKTDKVVDCGLKLFYGDLAGAPMIEECPVNLECKVGRILDLGSHYLVIGKIMETHVSEDCLTDGKPDVKKIRPIACITGQPGNYYSIGENVGEAFRIGKKLKRK